ncbi:MAG: NADP-dependent isocitrate dehydrogenase [Deltaproteobacteria bacterium]|jgi:isocitrate dehydrogenase|nr:NADP-dependent isocitrate dehydrogenase [Deltaproteobacteria bacterium]
MSIENLDASNLALIDAEIPVIIGDGVGPEIWAATEPILTKAAALSGKKLAFFEILAGEKAFKETGSHLPEQSLEAIKKSRIALKGPLATPVGKGIRSLNVAIRQKLDLYACVRPVKWIEGVPSPVKNPSHVDMILFRENTEDVYQGLEWAASSEQAQDLINYVKQRFNVYVRPNSAIGLKPMSEFGSKRLVRMALKWALKEKRTSLTLVHKGNIMKFTEGAFRTWGYELADQEFPGLTVAESEAAQGDTRLIVKDRIADNMFMQSLLRPAEYSVLAMPNLNGDYLSDCLAGQIGGLGMAPGANISDEMAVFEATHGTAPKYVGLDKVNPSSLILSGAFMLRYLGWNEAAELIHQALKRAFAESIYTYDLARQAGCVEPVKCSEFGRAVFDRLS